MESKVLLTRQLLEQCGVTDIQPDYFVRSDRQLIRSRQTNIITTPTIAKCKSKQGDLRYISLCVSLWDSLNHKYINTQYHRMVWAWHYGEVPVGYEIDHINTNPFDNRIENLRLTTRTENFNNKKNWKMFTVDEIENKSISEIRQMIFDRIEEYKDNPYKPCRNTYIHSEDFYDKHEELLNKRIKKRDEEKEEIKQNKLNYLYDLKEQINNNSELSTSTKQNKLKKLESIIKHVEETGNYGKKNDCLNYLKKTLSLS